MPSKSSVVIVTREEFPAAARRMPGKNVDFRRHKPDSATHHRQKINKHYQPE